MLKYAYGLKSGMIAAVIFALIGLFLEIVSHGTIWFSAFFIVASSMYAVQFLYCISLSDFALSSPYRKRLQTSMPACVNLSVVLVIFTIVLVLRMIWIRMYPQDQEKIVASMIFVVLMNIMFSAYISLAYKYFMISMLIIVVFSGGIGAFYGAGYMMRGETLLFMPQDHWIYSPLFMIIMTYVCVFAAAGVQYLVSVAIYKKPLSKRAQGAAMKRYL